VSGKERLHRAAIELIDVDVLACIHRPRCPSAVSERVTLSGE
jgi:hypothetical protein